MKTIAERIARIVVAPIYAEVERIKNMTDREKADSYLAAILASARAMK